MPRPWMPFYVSDYLGDTRHLSTLEHGAYLLLIFHYWQRGSLPDDDGRLAIIAGLSAEEWRRCRPTLVEFFTTGWKHERIDEELAEAASRSEKARAAAQAKWGKRPKGDANAYAPASAEHMPATATATVLASPSLRSEEAAQPREHFDLVETRCREAAGLTNARHPGLFNIAPILTLIREGFDLEAEVLPVLRAKAAAGKHGRSWAFYIDAIRETRAKSDDLRAQGKFDAVIPKPCASAPTTFVRAHTPQWDAWMDHYEATGNRPPKAAQTKAGLGWFFPSSKPPSETIAAMTGKREA